MTQENSEKIVWDFDYKDKEYNENAEVVKDNNGLMVITFDDNLNISHLRIINLKRNIRIDIDRYYNYVTAQVWFKTADTKLIKITADFQFDSGADMPFYEYADEYADVDFATEHWLREILIEYLKVPFEEEEEEKR